MIVQFRDLETEGSCTPFFFFFLARVISLVTTAYTYRDHPFAFGRLELFLLLLWRRPRKIYN